MEKNMSLEELYNSADTTTYVGRVRTTQASDANVINGVNFLDGTKRGRAAVADQFQTEFTRNEPGAYVVGGAQGSVPTTNNKTYAMSRWTQKSLKLAFEQDGPASLDKGYYTNRFRTATSKAGDVLVHNYTPLNGKGFKDVNVAARNRINSAPTSYF